MKTDKQQKIGCVSQSGALPCYLLICPFCGTIPKQDESGIVACVTCLEKDQVVAAPNQAAWNNRHSAQLTKRDIHLLMSSVERYADYTDDDIEMSNFEWKEKVELKKELDNLSRKIRLWLGR